jgi:glucuronate isomerase
MNASRNNNTRMFQRLGPDTGFNSINDSPMAYPLGKLLDSLDRDDTLPRTIVYSLNPKYYPVLATIMGNFQGGGIPGKLQFGSAWWFNDTKEGMLEQINTCQCRAIESVCRYANGFKKFLIVYTS